jgi:hypothetical protein
MRALIALVSEGTFSNFEMPYISHYILRMYHESSIITIGHGDVGAVACYSVSVLTVPDGSRKITPR